MSLLKHMEDRPQADSNYCSNCFFFEMLGEDEEYGEVGECHEDSPKPFISGVVLKEGLYESAFATTASWPLVQGTRWCGKHKAVIMEIDDGSF